MMKLYYYDSQLQSVKTIANFGYLSRSTVGLPYQYLSGNLFVFGYRSPLRTDCNAPPDRIALHPQFDAQEWPPDISPFFWLLGRWQWRPNQSLEYIRGPEPNTGLRHALWTEIPLCHSEADLSFRKIFLLPSHQLPETYEFRQYHQLIPISGTERMPRDGIIKAADSSAFGSVNLLMQFSNENEFLYETCSVLMKLLQLICLSGLVNPDIHVVEIIIFHDQRTLIQSKTD